MISIDELPEAPMTTTGVKLITQTLSDEDDSQLQFLDSQIEEVAISQAGSMFQISLERSTYSDSVISALLKLWESGGWTVGAFQFGDIMQVVFSRPRSAISTQRAVRDAMERREEKPTTQSHRGEGVIGVEREPKMTTPLLVRMPTRGRPEQALSALAAYRSLARSAVQIEVVIDEDDATMHDSRVLQRLADLDCVITVGRHSSKIHAVNAGRVDDWAILALASDDMVPLVSGYDEHIIAAMDRHFPLRDGAVYFDDGYNKSHALAGKPVLCTMPIMGRHLWEDFGYVYYREYGSLYSDNEQTELLTQMHRIAFVDEFIVEHRHHAAGKAAFDVVYQHNDNKWSDADKKLFETRAGLRLPGAQFAFESPPLTLSLLVCSTGARAHFLRRLERHLRAQMRRWPRRVELLVDVDDGQKPIGKKRNDLLDRAVGEYVAFIDDDDWVAHDYVDRLLRALSDGQHDCASLEGVITYDGERPERFVHTLACSEWCTEGGVHWRSPNHLNAVRRSIALEVRFPEKNFGEDHDFSKRVLPLLKSEADLGKQPLYYYWFRSKK